MALRPNLRRTTAAALHKTLGNAGIASHPNQWGTPARAGLARRPPAGLRGPLDGRLLQDIGAQWVPDLLDLAPGQRVLDACVGVKTAILERCDLELTAIELDHSGHGASRKISNASAWMRPCALPIAATSTTGGTASPSIASSPTCPVRPVASCVDSRHQVASPCRRHRPLCKPAGTHSRSRLWHALKAGGKMLVTRRSSRKNAANVSSARQPDARQLPPHRHGGTVSSALRGTRWLLLRVAGQAWLNESRRCCASGLRACC